MRTAALVAAVALLGAGGAVARFLADRWVASRTTAGLPLGTMVVNLSGAFLLGLLGGAGLRDPLPLLAGTATLGSYTTFSTWMFESRRLAEDGRGRWGGGWPGERRRRDQADGLLQRAGPRRRAPGRRRPARGVRAPRPGDQRAAARDRGLRPQAPPAHPAPREPGPRPAGGRRGGRPRGPGDPRAGAAAGRRGCPGRAGRGTARGDQADRVLRARPGLPGSGRPAPAPPGRRRDRAARGGRHRARPAAPGGPARRQRRGAAHAHRGRRRCQHRARPRRHRRPGRAPQVTLKRIRVCKRDGVLLAAPEEPPDSDRDGRPLWQKLMVHTSAPIYPELVRRLRAAGAGGATTLRGVWGYHGDHAPHGDRLLGLRRRVPVVTVVIDRPSRVRDWFAVIDALTARSGLVTSETVPAFHASALPAPPTA